PRTRSRSTSSARSGGARAAQHRDARVAGIAVRRLEREGGVGEALRVDRQRQVQRRPALLADPERAQTHEPLVGAEQPQLVELVAAGRLAAGPPPADAL